MSRDNPSLRDSTKCRRIVVDAHKRIDENGQPYLVCQCGRELRPSCGAKIMLLNHKDPQHRWRAHHLILHADGGEDTPDNLVPIREQCDVEFTAPHDTKLFHKNKRIREKRLGVHKQARSRLSKPEGMRYDWSQRRYVKIEEA